MQLSFDCANTDVAPVNSGLNTLLFSASATPTPDIVALAVTINNDGIVNIPGATGTGVFAVATVNVGASATITASADTGAATLPVNVSLCETNPATGACISAIGPSVTTQINANATPTFGIFVAGTGNVPFDPAASRIFVRFRDSGGVTRGSTSVAVRTQATSAIPDIRGTYLGSGSLTQTNCQDPADNGTFGFSSSVNISSQTGANFSGQATLTAVIAGFSLAETINFSGTVTSAGQLNGTFTYTFLVNSTFDSSGNGTLTGSVSGNTLNISFSGQDTVGNTCTFTGSLSGNR